MASEYIGVNGVARKVPTHYIGVDGVARNVKSGYVGVDGVARLFFAPEDGSPVILEVEKIVASTYANDTQYSGESFLLLDIYSWAGGTVKVTYGDLTKTLTFYGTNAQKVYFGTFNGETDSVATPSSGTLTIEGSCRGFGSGSYNTYNSSLNKSQSAYCNCITDVITWDSVTYIPFSAFRENTNITLSELPDGVTSIGNYAFYNCTGITLSKLPDGVTSIGSSAFTNCTGIALSKLPDGVTSIGGDAFAHCTGITLSKLPDGVTSIGGDAFYRCTGITLSKLPDNITDIGYSAFSGCTNITTITIPSNVTSIGYNPFYGTKLKDINGGSSAYAVINKCLVEVSTKKIIAGCANSVIPMDGSVEIIGREAFARGGNDFPTSVTLPACITSIEQCAFSSFNDTDAGSVGYLKNLTILATTPPTLGTKPFGGVNGSWLDTFVITVPKGCGNTYKTAAGWKDYANYIVEAS